MVGVKISNQEMGELTTEHELLTMENKLLGKISKLIQSIQTQLKDIKVQLGETQKPAEMAIQIGIQNKTIQKEHDIKTKKIHQEIVLE